MIDGGLRRLFRARIPGDWVSIESGMTDHGIPDSECCIGGATFWIEYKSTPGWSIKKSRSLPSQVGWHLRRARYGGRTFVAVRRAGDELWLFSGAHFRLLVAGGLRGGAPVLLRCEGGEARWDWEAVKKALTRGKK